MTTLTLPASTPTLTRPPVVVDSVRAAWDDSDKRAFAFLDTDWVKKHSDYLAPFAHELIRPFLAAEWREFGLTAQFEEDGRSLVDWGNETEPAAEICWAVWQAAADQVTTEALLTRAGINPNNYLHA